MKPRRPRKRRTNWYSPNHRARGLRAFERKKKLKKRIFRLSYANVDSTTLRHFARQAARKGEDLPDYIGRILQRLAWRSKDLEDHDEIQGKLDL